MSNRIRDLLESKGMTLAHLAASCCPPTTAQTIGRLEARMRSLSTRWFERIGRALEIYPELLVRSDQTPRANVVASLHASGPEALASPREAILPNDLAGAGATSVLAGEGDGSAHV